MVFEWLGEWTVVPSLFRSLFFIELKYATFAKSLDLASKLPPMLSAVVDDPKRKAPFKKQTTKKQKDTFKSQPLKSISSNPYHWKKTCKNKTVPLLWFDSQRHSSKRSCWSSRRERIAKPKRVAQANHNDPLLDDGTGAQKKQQEETTWTPPQEIRPF